MSFSYFFKYANLIKHTLRRMTRRWYCRCNRWKWRWRRKVGMKIGKSNWFRRSHWYLQSDNKNFNINISSNNNNFFENSIHNYSWLLLIPYILWNWGWLRYPWWRCRLEFFFVIGVNGVNVVFRCGCQPLSGLFIAFLEISIFEVGVDWSLCFCNRRSCYSFLK